MKRFHALSAIGALSLVHLAGAAITVDVTPPQAGVTYSVDGSNNVTIDATTAANNTALAITASPDPDDGEYIGNIVVNTSSNPMHRVFVSINSDSSTVGYPINTGVLGVKDLRRGSGSAELWLDDAFIRGELGSLTSEGVPTGFLRVNIVSGTVTVRRNILADIEALGTGAFTPPSGRVINSVNVPINDQNLSNNEDPFLCHGCDDNDQSILGSVRAYGGGIGSIYAYNALGFVGEEVLSQGPVGSITAGGLAGIFIDMPGYDLGSLVAERGGWGGDPTVDDDGNPSMTPSYPGWVSARKINVFQLKGDMQSELSVGFGPSSNQVWKIGGSLTSTGLLEFTQDQNLKHQIVINEQVDGGTWDSGGQIKVGNSPAYTLNALYNTLPGNLGNGSVGAAPYAIHTKATSPEPFKTASIGYLDLSSIQVPPAAA